MTDCYRLDPVMTDCYWLDPVMTACYWLDRPCNEGLLLARTCSLLLARPCNGGLLLSEPCTGGQLLARMSPTHGPQWSPRQLDPLQSDQSQAEDAPQTQNPKYSLYYNYIFLMMPFQRICLKDGIILVSFMTSGTGRSYVQQKVLNGMLVPNRQ